MSVLIVGAGIAGLSCGYNLDILNAITDGEINLRILEARSRVGGRIQNVKEEADFIDFDLDMGGQDLFVHDFSAYENYLSDGEDFPYRPESWARAEVDYLECDKNLFRHTCTEKPFPRNFPASAFYESSLATFVTDNFLPRVRDNVHLNTVVTDIDYSSDSEIVVTAKKGRTSRIFTADQLVLAVPISQLKKGAITFNPPLPSSYANLIDDTEFTEGVRIWVEFSEKFYKDVTEVNGRTYWDAARGKDTDKHIITIQGLKEPQLAQMTDEQIKDEVLFDLDVAYDQKARAAYVAHFVKNWQEEEFIEMANARRSRPPANLDLYKEPVDDRIWFAGDYTLRGPENEAAESGKFVAGKVYQELTNKPGLCEYYSDNGLIVDDEVCFSVSDQCDATADLGGESCDAWCARRKLTCTGAWDDGAGFCEKEDEISCGATGKGRSICRCGVGLCEDFLGPVDLIVEDEICSAERDTCEALADLGRNNNESCDAWCARKGYTCAAAWNDKNNRGPSCEKKNRISCSTTGKTRSICKCVA